MSKILSFCSLLGKIISIYFIMFLVSLMCVTFSPINKNNTKKRCNIELNSYEYSFLENIKEIKSYNVYFSCKCTVFFWLFQIQIHSPFFKPSDFALLYFTYPTSKTDLPNVSIAFMQTISQNIIEEISLQTIE